MQVMTKIQLILASIIIASCTSSGYNGSHEVDWMPDRVVWEQNIIDCRRATVCRAEDLFKQ